MTYSKSYHKNIEKNTYDSTIGVVGDTVLPNMIFPCIDCFVRLDAVQKDKSDCIKENLKLEIANAELFAESADWQKKARRRPWYFAIGGILTGMGGSIYLLSR